MSSSVVATTPYHTELIDGREVPKPLPKILHARLQSYLILAIGNQLHDQRPGWEVLSEQNILCGDERLVPDVLIVGPDAHYVDGDLASPAVMAVEILSPGQDISDLFTKAGKIMKSGTPFCVILWPERQRCWTYTLEDINEDTERQSIRAFREHQLDIDPLAMWASLMIKK
jgi:Uma2 family endonuclease